MSANNHLILSKNLNIPEVIGPKFMANKWGNFKTSLGIAGDLGFRMNVSQESWDANATLQNVKSLFSEQEKKNLTSGVLISKLEALLIEGFSPFYRFSTQVEIDRIAQIRTLIQLLDLGLNKKLASSGSNLALERNLKAQLKTLSELEGKVPKSAYAKKRNARISKIMDRSWFAALSIFSWVVHLKNLGVHQFMDPTNPFGPPVALQLPTQGFKYFYQSIAANHIAPFFSNLFGVFNSRLSKFTRGLKGLKAFSSLTYAVSGIFSMIGIAATQSFLSLYAAGISTLSLDLLSQASLAAKGMVKFLAFGALFGIVASSISATVSLLKFAQSAWKVAKGDDSEKAVHKQKLNKRGVSLVGNALMAIGFGIALVSGPIGWSLLGAGALMMVGLKVTQVVKSYRAKKAEEKSLETAVNLSGANDPVNIPVAARVLVQQTTQSHILDAEGEAFDRSVSLANREAPASGAFVLARHHQSSFGSNVSFTEISSDSSDMESAA